MDWPCRAHSMRHGDLATEAYMQLGSAAAAEKSLVRQPTIAHTYTTHNTDAQAGESELLWLGKIETE